MQRLPAPLLLIVLLAVAPRHVVRAQGSLLPPGPPAPAMRTLDQLEPRRPISAAGETLTTPGSYYLTADLAGNGTVPGLTVAGPNITVDLNGYSIARTLNVGAEPGVVIQAGATQARLHNGRIRGWGGDGVRALGSGTGHVFEDLLVLDCGGHGLRAGDEATVSRCLVQYSTGDGIQVGQRSRVEDCRAADNGGVGVRAGVDVVVARTHGSRSGGTGIQLDERSVALDCVAGSNAGYGIFGIGNNVVRGGTFVFNSGGGIFLQQAGRVAGARLQGNATVGVRCGQRGVIEDTVCEGVTDAGAVGLMVGDQGVIARSTSNAAAGTALQTGSQSTVRDCSAAASGVGIEVADGCLVVDCRTTGNTGSGLRVGLSNQVRGLHASQNGAEGIFTASSGNRIEGCTLTLNGGFGLVLAAPGNSNVVFRNTIAQNATGNLSAVPGQIVAPAITSGSDPNLSHPNANAVY